MRTLQEVRDKCEVTPDGHWLWEGGLSAGKPTIRAPNYTKDASGKTMEAQRAVRAVWHIKTKKPLPAGVHVYAKCWVPMCVNPACLTHGPMREMGASMSEAGVVKNNTKMTIANRVKARARRKVTEEMVSEIMSSNETSRALADRFNVHQSTVSIWRRGQAGSSSAGFFAGLMR